MAMKLKRGDTVQVIAGRDKGTRGEVLRVLPKEARLVVQGVNLRKKNQKKVQAGGRTTTPGSIQFVEGPQPEHPQAGPPPGEDRPQRGRRRGLGKRQGAGLDG